LAPISQQLYNLLSGAIPHALTAHGLHSLKTVLLCLWPPSQGPGPPACRPTVSEAPNFKTKLAFDIQYNLRDREREKEVEGSERDYIEGVGGKKCFFFAPVLKVLRQCPLRIILKPISEE
jgi:hypothetical protein